MNTPTAPEAVVATGDRTASVTRNTAETKITVSVNLDGSGRAKLSTGIGFFDHMLDQIARHGLIDLDIDCQGDLHIDGHHTVEESASRSARRSRRPSATRRASAVTAMLTCRSTRRSAASSSTFPAARGW